MAARAFGLAAIAVALLIPQFGYAGLMHKYTGTPFPEVSGTDFTTDDFVSGIVMFLAEPIPGSSFDQDDVAFFAFFAGPLIIDSDTGSMYRGTFDFDSAGNIDGWDLGVGSGLSDIVTSDNPHPSLDFGFDQAILELDSVGTSAERGTWQAVPEPCSVVLWLSAGVVGLFGKRGLGQFSRQRRRHGQAADSRELR